MTCKHPTIIGTGFGPQAKPGFLTRLLQLLLVAVLLGACGGKGSPLPGNTAGDENTDSSAGGSTATESTVSVFLSKGPITDATCRLYDRNNNSLGLSGSTDNAEATLGSTGASGLVYVECKEGRYTDEASDATAAVPLTLSLRGAARLTPGRDQTIVVTPLTEIAFRLAAVENNQLLNYETYASRVTSMLGFDIGADLAAVIPAKNANTAANDAAGHYSAVLAVLSQYQLNRGGVNTYPLDDLITEITAGISGTNLNADIKTNLLNAANSQNLNDKVASGPLTTIRGTLARQSVSIGGSVTGLANGSSVGLQLEVQNSISATITVTGGTDNDVAFNFVEMVGNSSMVKWYATGLRYQVSIVPDSLPANTICDIDNASGITGTTNIQNILVSCHPPVFTLGGTVFNLENSMVLTETVSNQTLTISPDNTFSTPFTFNSPLTPNVGYNVTISQQPTSQTCTIENSSGTITSNTNDVRISCPVVSAIRQVDVVQTLSQPANSQYQILVPNRPAMVRAYVYDGGTPFTSSVNLTVGSAAPVAMICPNNLPDNASSEPPIHLYNNTTTCYTTLSAAQVIPGLALTVSVGNNAKTVRPVINTKSEIPLQIVRLTAGGATAEAPQLPELETSELETFLLRRMPLSNIIMTARATPLSVSVADVTSEESWLTMLASLETARASEFPNGFYYGLVPTPVNFNGGILGLAYTPGLSAIGMDSKIDAIANYNEPVSATTMAHELGHNLSLLHAPCGDPDPDSIDSFWYSNPWTGAGQALLSPAAIYDGSSLLDPRTTGYDAATLGTDIMAYCRGGWFSEYSYHKMADFLQYGAGNPQPPVETAAPRQTIATQNMLRISGGIDAANRISLMPTTASRGFQPSSNSGDYLLRLTTRNQEVVEHFFQAVAIGDATAPVLHFAVNLPDPGPLTRIEVLYRGEPLQVRPAVGNTMAARLASGSSSQQSPSWTESNQKLTVSWDNASYPWLQLTHIADNGQRQVLAVNHSGGQVELPTQHLPAGGQWEIVLSDGMNVQSQLASR